ncbi:MAG: hypothetical protein KC616_12770 [Myxococcales bacterium]|nr:hypothetical protein [Myxococcales bacterium]
MLAAATNASARELELSVDGRVGGDSNILRRAEDEIEDGFFELSPKVRVRESSDALNYDLFYRPTYQTFFDTSGVDGFDHRAEGEVAWSIDPKQMLGVSASYLNARRLRFDSDVASGPNIFEVSDRERLQRTAVDAYYQHQLTERLLGRASVAFDDYDYRRNLNFDSRGFTGQLYGQYAVDSRLSLGLTGTARRRITAPVTGTGGDVVTRSTTRIASTTDVFSLGASVNWQVTPTFRASVQAGPSLIISRQRPDSRQFAAGTRFTRESDVTVFAQASATKEWDRANLDVSYVRSESRGAGTSSSSISDLVNVAYGRALTHRWYLRLNGSWDQREQILKILGGSRLKVTQYRTQGTLSYRLTRQWQVIGQYAFVRQERDQFFGTSDTIHAHTGFLSLRYTFDPIPF